MLVIKASNVNSDILTKLDIPDGCCCYCGRRMNNILGHDRSVTIDHVIPKCNGGTNRQYNRLPCCMACNRWKANNSLEYFLDQVIARMKINVGGSHCSLKRWRHMFDKVYQISELIKVYKRPDRVPVQNVPALNTSFAQSFS